MASLQDAVKEAASALKDIKIKKGYKEEPIPWKRLIMAIGISAAAGVHHNHSSYHYNP